MAYVADDRFAEPRVRLYGTIEGIAHCVAGTDRGGIIRVILSAALARGNCAAMSNETPIVRDEDNPEWTAEDFARARRGADIPPHIQAAFGKSPRGRPVGSTTSNKTQVTLRLDRDALERLKADGPGWQTRINEAVRKAAGL